MCVCMHVVCAAAIGAYVSYANVQMGRSFSLVCVCVHVCVYICVFLLCSGWKVGNNNPSLVEHIQCSLNDGERERVGEREIGMCKA